MKYLYRPPFNEGITSFPRGVAEGRGRHRFRMPVSGVAWGGVRQRVWAGDRDCYDVTTGGVNIFVGELEVTLT